MNEETVKTVLARELMRSHARPVAVRILVGYDDGPGDALDRLDRGIAEAVREAEATADALPWLVAEDVLRDVRAAVHLVAAFPGLGSDP